ncbi:uncharacterized protein LOC142324491 [Lycorma delicatula]|uniref:uncharacterized protein LOC142324491 n=1 Tax=Lycorma delicatula TaxID=130591 RepID=UPI003F50FD7F
MKFNPDGFITTNAVLLSIVFFTIASAYSSVLPKFKEERKAGSTEEEEGLGFKSRIQGFGLDHTNFWLGKARFRRSALGASVRIMPIFGSDIARYDTIIPFNYPKISEDRVIDLVAKVPAYASPMHRVSGFRPRIKGFEPKLTIFQPKIAGSESKLFNNRHTLLEILPFAEGISLLPEIIPEIAPEIIPEIASEVIPEITPAIIPAIIPEITPEITPDEITPDEITPDEITPDRITPQKPPDVIPLPDEREWP